MILRNLRDTQSVEGELYASLVKGRWHGVAVTEGFCARNRTAARAVPTMCEKQRANPVGACIARPPKSDEILRDAEVSDPYKS